MIFNIKKILILENEFLIKKKYVPFLMLQNHFLILRIHFLILKTHYQY